MKSLSESERLKAQRALLLFSNNERIPAHYIKYIRDGVYEFRVTHGNNEFRIFFCYDGDTLVILFNGIRKKYRIGHAQNDTLNNNDLRICYIEDSEAKEFRHRKSNKTKKVPDWARPK